MTPSIPYFRSFLFPSFIAVDGFRVDRFLLQTAWQVRRANATGVEGVPKRFDSLLVLDELPYSVLPFTFHTRHRIYTTALPNPAPDWRGIPCTFGLADLWLFHAASPTTLRLSIQILLPRQAAHPEPLYPLLGAEFFRHYGPQLTLQYAQFNYASALTGPSPPSPVGWMEWF